MGKIWSKKAKSTRELLETLDEKIKSIEAYTVSTQEKQKRLIGQFLVISIGLYVIAFIVFYFLFFPPTWEKRIVYSTPLLIFPFVIFLIKRLVAWYFQRKVNKNSSQLKELRTEKKELLEQVMDKETYKVALELLSRFSEKPMPLRTNPSQQSTVDASPKSSFTTPRSTTTTQGLQQRMTATVGRVEAQQRALVANQQQRGSPYSTAPRTPYTPYQQPNRTMPMPNTPYNVRTPFPIIDQRAKSVVEKLVDYLVGDGPSNRYAMICKQCSGHNGMALQEEYEYTTFKCAFCGMLNPARKQRPIAPRLESTPERKLAARKPSSSGTSDEEKFSGSDSDDEKLTKTQNETKTLENTAKEPETVEASTTEETQEEKPETEKKED
ncbi:endoplasmic reticulum junction formation protein lunapark-B [Culicoides brevitarsis]|uniref:endoplasmic reticulum junction formation protein lunapark-B n=1 Tax=Culicoides brevitarsis TaxID=469753 RepID=UPI00307BAE9D